MGKLGWTPYEYYTSSPQEFYHACKGYFDKEESSMLIQRKLAQVIWGGNGGKPDGFDNFWPIPDGVKKESVVKTWGTKEEAMEFRNKIMKDHNIKLK